MGSRSARFAQIIGIKRLYIGIFVTLSELFVRVFLVKGSCSFA